MIPTGNAPIQRRCLYLEDTSQDDGFDALGVPAEFEAAAGEVLCQAVLEFGGTWYVVAPNGHAIR
jgi:hypothetical protein